MIKKIRCASAARWSHGSDGESSGVRFPKLKADDRHRLQELVLRFATFQASSQQHTAFRLP
jgi:hypothetical protein